MTTKDTTGDKLVASIRKTKTGTAAGGEPEKKKVARKAAPKSRKKAAPAKARSAKTTPTTRERNTQLIDLFQSGRRVWPD